MKYLKLFILSVTLLCTGFTFSSCNNKAATGDEQGTSSVEAVDEETSQASSSVAEAASESIGMEKGPKVIDFYATWCKPCKMMNPIVEAMKKKYGKQIAFEAVDIDQNQFMAMHYQVNAVPTFFFISRKGKAQRVEGSMSESDFDSKLAWTLIN